MKNNLQLVASTLVLTVLVWAYADRATRADLPVWTPLRVMADAPGSDVLVIMPDPLLGHPDTQRVKMTLSGPRAAIQALEADHARGEFGVTVTVSGDLANGEHTRDLFVDLGRAPELVRRGLTLVDVEPKSLTFEVDRYVRREVTLTADAGAYTEMLTGTPVFEPARVTARVRRSQLGDLTPPALPVPLAEAIGAALASRPETPESPEDPLTLTVPLRSSAWQGMDATFTPSTVAVTLSLRRGAARERLDVKPLGVTILSAEFLDGGYAIEWEDETVRLGVVMYVRVPSAKLERFRRLDPRAFRAYVIIDDQDVQAAGGATFRSKPVHLDAPDGFEDVKPAGEAMTVNLRVIRTTDPAGSEAVDAAP